jgi:hypothetical protein
MPVKDEHRIRARFPGSITVGVALLASGVSAVALGATTARDQITVPARSHGTATSTCEPDKTAVAGGFAAPGLNTGEAGPVAVRLISKLTGARTLTTQAFNFGDQPAQFVSLAYCVGQDHGITVRSNKAFLGPGSPGSATAGCGNRSRVVGGGFGTQGFSRQNGPAVITLTSRRVGLRDWRVEGINIGGDGNSGGGRPGTLIAYAYCQRHAPRLATESRRAEVSGTNVTTVQAKCPPGARAYSGGFDGDIRLTANPSASGATTSKRADHGRAWRVDAVNVFDVTKAHVTSYAYCDS